MAPTLSQLLMDQIRQLDKDCLDELAIEERSQSDEANKIADRITRALLRSRTGMTTQKIVRQLEELHSERTQLEFCFDDHYTRRLLKEVRKIVNRTMRLSSLIVQDPPSEMVRLYVEEAGRSYVFGFWRSTIALSRAALESALRERLERNGLSDLKDLKDLISVASKLRLLDAPHAQFASEIQRAGNQAMHPRSSKTAADDKLAFDTIASLRGVLLYLYREPTD